MLIDLGFSFEAGGKQEHSVVDGKHRKFTRRLDVQLLRWDKLALLGVPLVDLRQRIIAAQDGILPFANRDGLKDHGAAGGESLQLSEHGAIPAHYLGVSDKSRQAYEQLT